MITLVNDKLLISHHSSAITRNTSESWQFFHRLIIHSHVSHLSHLFYSDMINQYQTYSQPNESYESWIIHLSPKNSFFSTPGSAHGLEMCASHLVGPWDSGRCNKRRWMFVDVIMDVNWIMIDYLCYPLVNIHKTMENHHC